MMRLNALHRRAKFAVLMIAAWAPLVLSQHPLVAAAVLMTATVVFFLATRAQAAAASSEPTPGAQSNAEC
jgi:hypothetical protein